MPAEPRAWRYGDAVALRYFRGGRPSWVKPVRVVEDSDELTALFLAAGTPIRKRARLDGSAIDRSLPYEERFPLAWRLTDAQWVGNHVLELTRPGAAHSYWLLWRAPSWSFSGWYVNLQAPLRRSAVGFDTADHVLDVVVRPDLSWRWKDEDELDAAVAVGHVTAAEARAIRAEGERALAALTGGAWPFDAPWARWRPDPTWTIPRVRDDWERVPHANSPLCEE